MRTPGTLAAAMAALLGGCPAAPSAIEAAQQHDEAEVSLQGEDVLTRFVARDGWLVSDVLPAPEGATRVGVLLMLADAGDMPAIEARGIGDRGAVGPWLAVAATFSEGVNHVALAELGDAWLAAQLRVRPDDASRVDWLTWNAVTPADPEIAFVEPSEDDLQTERARSTIAHPNLRTREQWGARPTRCRSRDADKHRMAIHYTVTPSDGDVAARLRGIQRYHMDTRGWCDVGYHFLVSTDGTIWEGRPLELLGAHVGSHNSGNVGIAFVGCFHGSGCERWGPVHPPEGMIRVGGELVGLLARTYDIPLDAASVKGHREHRGAYTSCPGDHLLARLPDLRAIAASSADPPPPGEPPIPEDPPPPETPASCEALACGECAATAGCSPCASRGGCVDDGAACAWDGAIGGSTCAASYWPCGTARCWDPTAALGRCGTWSKDEDFSSGRYGVHRYALRLEPGGPVDLSLTRTGGAFTPAMIVTDRAGALVWAGDDMSLHPTVSVEASESGRAGGAASVTLTASSRIDLRVHVTDWGVVDAGLSPRVARDARYRLQVAQRCR